MQKHSADPHCTSISQVIQHVLLPLTVLALALCASHLAHAESSISTASYCVTAAYGITSLASVPTRTTTVRTLTTPTVKSLNFPFKSVTPPAVTRTTTQNAVATTTRTVSGEDAETTTETSYIYAVTTASQDTITFTNTITITTSPAGPLSTVSTSAGFTPIKTIPGNTPSNRRIATLGAAAAATSYPRSIVCSVVIRTATYTTVKDTVGTYTWRLPTPTSTST